MPFEQDEACNMAWHIFIFFYIPGLRNDLYVVSNRVLAVIHTDRVFVYTALLGCLHRLQNKENGSEPPKHRRVKGVRFVIIECLPTLCGVCACVPVCA